MPVQHLCPHANPFAHTHAHLQHAPRRKTRPTAPLPSILRAARAGNAPRVRTERRVTFADQLVARQVQVPVKRASTCRRKQRQRVRERVAAGADVHALLVTQPPAKGPLLEKDLCSVRRSRKNGSQKQCKKDVLKQRPNGHSHGSHQPRVHSHRHSHGHSRSHSHGRVQHSQQPQQQQQHRHKHSSRKSADGAKSKHVCAVCNKKHGEHLHKRHSRARDRENKVLDAGRKYVAYDGWQWRTY